MYLGKLAELATANELCTAPKHPYTGALLSAVPIANPRLGRGRSAFVLKGDVPNPINPPSGCRFHPRCPRAQETCAADDPPLARHGARHEAACFFPLERWPLTEAEMRGGRRSSVETTLVLKYHKRCPPPTRIHRRSMQ